MRSQILIFPLGDCVDFRLLGTPSPEFLAMVRQELACVSVSVHHGKLRLKFMLKLSAKQQHAAIMRVVGLYQARLSVRLHPQFRHPKKVARAYRDCQQTLVKELAKLNPEDAQAARRALTRWLES